MNRWMTIFALCVCAPTAAADSSLPDHVGLVEISPAALGLRYQVALGKDARLRVGPGLALGTTGLIGSLHIARELHSKRETTPLGTVHTSFLIFGGGSVDFFRGAMTRQPFAGETEWIPTGEYIWLELGGHIEGRVGRFVIGLQLGASILVGAPDGLGDVEVEDEDLLWWTAPEGWIRRRGWVPIITSSVGAAF